ncbi:hypothetical protein [Uliginosibacterium aquaticum]|uniref:DUF3829 domain-containing protein n=1 Tax=Uliginosibacterium aquaticum TaxID=2731212 RepID=A0ABX2IE89_9RHOO|nr:hypothetical protein [Uliginosibacterium aquaticum]NSL54961.1 hypothetical protein [Uliginosibacterium aquaticum]
MFKPALIFSFLLATGIANAADPFTDAMLKAYAPYRAALFKTNQTSQPDAQQAIAQARTSWASILKQFMVKAPPPYDRDTQFADSLAEVSKVYDKAAAEIDKGQLIEAHETLEEARDVMAQLRARNNVIVFSDHMNAYHAQMEHVLIEGPKILDGANGFLELTAQTGALEMLANKLASEASADLRGNEEFKTSCAAVQKSVTDLKAALFSQDKAKVKEALGKIKVPYSKMFIKFG